MNFYELLVQQAEVYKDQPLLVTEAGTKTYRSLLAAVDAYAAGAAAYAPGAQVLVETEGVFGGLTAFLALQKKRAVPILQPRGMSADACAHLWEMLRARGAAPPCAAFGVLSSGSTGTPKIILRSYQSWAGFFPAQNEVFAVDAATRLFLQGSLSFTGNLNALLSVLYAGGTLISAGSHSLAVWMGLLEQHYATHIYLVPAKLRLFLRGAAARGQGRQYGGVRMLFTGSGLLSADDIAGLSAAFPQTRIRLYYGASEVNFISWRDVTEGIAPAEAANVGRPFAGVSVSVSSTGELLIDTPWHAEGIAVPCALGDHGALTPEGAVLFAGRAGDFVNKGGVKLNTQSIERKLRTVPGVADAAVLPIKDAQRGMDIAAFVVPSAGTDRSDLRRIIRHALTPVENPHTLRFLAELPLTGAGKVAYQELRTLLS